MKIIITKSKEAHSKRKAIGGLRSVKSFNSATKQSAPEEETHGTVNSEDQCTHCDWAVAAETLVPKYQGRLLKASTVETPTMVQMQANGSLPPTERWNYWSMLVAIGWMVRQEGVGSLQWCRARADKLGMHVAASNGVDGDGARRGPTILPFTLA